MTPEQRADLAEALVPVALSLAYTVHTDGPPAVAQELSRVPPPRLPALAVVLAAMVDLDRTPHELLAWAEARPWAPRPEIGPDPATSELTACLAHQAWKAHRRGERDPDGWLEAGYRIYERERGRAKHRRKGVA